MPSNHTFNHRGIVEGFFGPPWGPSQRAHLFVFGQRHGMNTYLYAPKDDPYHREHWEKPYPEPQRAELLNLIALANHHGINFVYGFHPGKNLRFSADEPIGWLLRKAAMLYKAGVRTFAVLFDDIPSSLQFSEDQKTYHGSLARAEGRWLKRITEQQPADWTDVEWWMCPSYYSEDPFLARVFGRFETSFLETLGESLPDTVACFWTGPSVVSKSISAAHIRKIIRALNRRLLIWDNYPVNDLSMSMEMHLDPLTGRDPRLPDHVYGYLNNPLLQASLSLIPLASCFDYAANTRSYDPELSWERGVAECFGTEAVRHWRALREFCNRINPLKEKQTPMRLTGNKRSALERARDYLLKHRNEPWAEEFAPWLAFLEVNLEVDHRLPVP